MRCLAQSLLASLLAGLASMMLSGCVVGPNYEQPDVILPQQWSGGSDSTKLDAKALRAWWKTFGDRKLNSLISNALELNPDLRAAAARLWEARSRRVIAGSARFPTLDAKGSVIRNEFSQTGRMPFETSTVYAGGFDAAWELDLFGGLRRQVEAADAKLDASIADFYHIQVTLLGELALNYVEVRTFQARLDVAEANRDAQAKTLELVESNVRAGEVSQLDREQARGNLEATKAQIPQLEAALAKARHRLAVLLGWLPTDLDVILRKRQAVPVAPNDIAIGIPADALRRRPDVLRAERQLAAETARVGVAVADLYPKLTLIGTVGLESLKSGDFLTSASRVFDVGPSVRWNLFSAGRVRQGIEIQCARQEQALIAYQKAILRGLQDVENALAAYGSEMIRRDALIRSEQAARRSVEIAQDQYEAGETSFLTVLDAQRSRLRAQDQLALSHSHVTSNIIMLYKALGGGW
jgi:NodT family efflux transporter outer membrane factor (OMF) lipoprotein